MKLTQLLLCKTPFTPSYEHLVTGCSSTEFYNKLATEDSTQTISPANTPNITFRPVRETDREIVFSLNMIGKNALYIKPQEYNYVATYEQNPTSRRFWFIESYNVDNSGVYPTVTFYCSIDYWHSYCLDGKIYEQNIVRATQNGRVMSSNQYLHEDSGIYHTVNYISNDRILWARIRINTLILVDSPSAIGSSLEGSVPFVYIPVGIVKNNVFSYLESTINSTTIHNWEYVFSGSLGYEIDEDSFNYVSGLPTNSVITDGNVVLQYVGNWGFIESASLTYLPPFDYSFNESNKTISVGTVTRASFTFDSRKVTAIVPDNTSEYIRTILYNVDLPVPSVNNPDSYFYNRYPFVYYSVFVGEREFKFPYPLTSVQIDVNSKCCSDSNIATLIINGVVVEDNIQVNLSIPLVINKDAAGIIEATYGSSYREMSALARLLPIASSLVSFNVPSPNVILNKFASNANIVKSYMEYKGEVNTPVGTYIPQTNADAIAFGDYPFMVRHTPHSTLIPSIVKRIRIYGERVLKVDSPITVNHRYFDYVQTNGASVISDSLNDRGNNALSTAFNNGLHLWHFDYINKLSDVGVYPTKNPNR